MIKELRVDDRLIHGQIALTWPKALQINHIIVANDKASKDKTQQMSLKMAVSGNVKVLIRSITDTIKLLENPKAKAIGMMVIVNTVEDARKLQVVLQQDVERINIANVGRFDGLPNDKKLKIGSSILLTDSAKKAAKELLKDNANVVHQIIPSNNAENFNSLLKEA